MPRSLGRTGHRWRKLVEQVKSEESCCWICGSFIDPYAKPRSPMSFSVDHLFPLMNHPELALVRSNVRAAHLRCNVMRGNRMRAGNGKDRTSRTW